MIGLITRIIYFVKDMEKATAFYRDKLGLTVGEDPQLSPSEWVEFDADPCRLALHKAFDPKGTMPATYNKIVFYSDDPIKTRDELIAKGVKIHEPMTDQKLVLCNGEDPEGNRFQISNNPSRCIESLPLRDIHAVTLDLIPCRDININRRRISATCCSLTLSRSSRSTSRSAKSMCSIPSC